MMERCLFALAALLTLAPAASRAQDGVLPRSEAESLIDGGRWAEAEEMLYASVRERPRDPVARARLGRYLAMKGALRPGLVLVEEAGEFGLPSATVRALATPIRTLLDWRERVASSARDSTIFVRPPTSAGALMRFPLERPARGDTLWAELVPRMIAFDSAFGANPRVGIETIDAAVPAFDVADHIVRLHADPRSALRAVGRRYPVLRTEREVRVLLAPGRVRPLDEALRELTPRWWQLDLPHGLLVVR
ncbi:MAG: hypothetical protein ACJ79A_03425 [Gemmatimonadaceae bacterium]